MKDVVLAVPYITSFSVGMSSLRFTRARMVAPIAPTPAASVGEAMPQKMEPSTARMSRLGAIMALNTAHSIRAVLVGRSEEHTSELQAIIRISYAVFCLQNKNTP